MAKFHRDHTENTDAQETMFFQAANPGKSTDQYDTQQMNAQQIRQQAARQGYADETDIYTQPGNPDGYAQQPGYGQGSYPPQNRYPRQGGYTEPGNYPRQGGYTGQHGDPARRYPSGKRPPQGQRPVSRQPEASRYRATSPPPQRRPQPERRTPPPRQECPQTPPRQKPSAEYAYDPPRRHSAPPEYRESPQSQRRPKSSLLYRVVRTICILIVGLFLLYSAVALVGILSMNRVETGARSYTSGSLDASYVKNVLVIGTDARDLAEERGRSDSMILVSINSKTGNCYMTSLMRDSYVEIPGNGSGKLNAAYSYGGAELLMDTIEYNFDVRIDDYVLFTFAACADAIDAVGGVELELSDEEAQAVNEILISEVNEIMGDDREDDLLSGGGKLKLSGKQALSYSRIRYVGNADFERTERQRVVMQQVMEKALGNPFRLAALCMRALPEMTTNLSVGALYGYAIVTPVQLLFYDLQQQRIPDDTMYQGANIGGESVLQVDFTAARALLEETVYAR